MNDDKKEISRQIIESKQASAIEITAIIITIPPNYPNNRHFYQKDCHRYMLVLPYNNHTRLFRNNRLGTPEKDRQLPALDRRLSNSGQRQ